MARPPRFTGYVELGQSLSSRPHLSHVLFDFDGTLSLLREGWPDVMLPMFLEMLPAHSEETEAERRTMLFDDIMRLNGKQTIYQMMQFAERIRERGGEPEDPLRYKQEYLRRLDARIAARLQSIKEGAEEADDFLVFGTRSFLQSLQRRGFELYLASGTDEPFVRREAGLLGIDQFFGEHIYGAQDDYKQFSKKMVIDRLLRDNGIDGSRLLSFGDGFVEIENTKKVGGLAVAVASDERNNGSGEVDQWKRDRLLGVGADVVIPDYRDGDSLLDVLLGNIPSGAQAHTNL